jgi:hypothetical protein
MAGQNHAEPRQDHCRQDHKRRGPITLLLMILSCHDSVAFHLAAALPRYAAFRRRTLVWIPSPEFYARPPV